MHLTERDTKLIYLERKAFNERIKNLNVETDEGIQELIQSVKMLQPQPESLASVKKIMLMHGLAIMIHLKPFYDNFPPKDVQNNKRSFQLLAGLAKQITLSIEIPQIKFFFKHGQAQYPLQATQIESFKKQTNFINCIKQISKLNQLVVNKKQTISFQKYNELLQGIIKDKKFTKLMQRAICDFSLKRSQIRDDDWEVVERNDKAETESNSSWSSQVSGEEESFTDFYQHHVQDKNYSKQSGISQLSYSLNSTNNIQSKLQYLCCRKYFYEDETINSSEDLRTSFSSQKYPFSEIAMQELRKIICSFLNCQGGKLYVGIQKLKNGSRKVITEIYTESEKEEILKSFRKIAEGIEPEIIIKKMYNVQFVPIKDENGHYIPGANVIKVSVNYGARDQVYSYSMSGYDYFPFRNDLEIVEKNGRQLLKFYRNIIKTPLPPPEPLHPEPCEKPDIGEPAHSHFQGNYQFRSNKVKLSQAYTEVRPSSISFGNQSLKNQPYLKNTVQSHPHSVSLSGNKSVVPVKNRSEMPSHESLTTKKQIEKHRYFYVVGLDERHLTPIFVEKKLNNNIKIESTTQLRLVVRVHGQSEIDKTRKILKKIESKYKQKNIIVYEMSLQLQIDNRFEQALAYIKNNKLIHKIHGSNRLKFKLIRDSFRAFLQLQSHKIPVKFIVASSEQNNPNTGFLGL